MQVLAEVVVLHQTSGITAAQAEACAALTICKVAALMQPQGSRNQPTHSATPAQKPACAAPGQVSPVTPNMMLPAANPLANQMAIPPAAAIGEQRSAASKANHGATSPAAATTPAAATKGQRSAEKGGGNEASEGALPALQPSLLMGCTRQLASLLQHASLHVLRTASAGSSDELAQVRFSYFKISRYLTVRFAGTSVVLGGWERGVPSIVAKRLDGLYPAAGITAAACQLCQRACAAGCLCPPIR